MISKLAVFKKLFEKEGKMRSLKLANISGLVAIAFIAVSLPSFCNAATMEDIVESYKKGDYIATAAFIEQQIKQAEEKASAGDKAVSRDLYPQYLLLGYIYAWRLNKYDEALKVYQKMAKFRESSEQMKKTPPIEKLFIAEIWETKNDFSRAKENYKSLLDELIARKEHEQDELSMIMGDELTGFIKYQIDGIALKENPKGDVKLLLTKFKPSASIQSPVMSFSMMFFVPTIQHDMTIAMKQDMASYIEQSPANMGNMFRDYFLIFNASASSVTESSEKAMQAYLAKYPESYYSLLLRQMFYKFYKENNQPEKAKQLLTEIKNIAQKRKMEIITEPDKRFASPEATWKTYKNALMQGNLEEAMECFAPGEGTIHKQTYAALGKDKMKEIGKDMGDVIRVSGDEQMAVYQIIRKEKGQNYSYEVRFYNIGGEWKLGRF